MEFLRTFMWGFLRNGPICKLFQACDEFVQIFAFETALKKDVFNWHRVILMWLVNKIGFPICMLSEEYYVFMTIILSLVGYGAKISCFLRGDAVRLRYFVISADTPTPKMRFRVAAPPEARRA